MQALDRTQPLLPLSPGQAERQSHDYKGHGTTALFAALDIATDRVLGRCYRRHRATSSAASSMPSTLPCRSISISIWSWTITPPTRRRPSKPGLPNGLAITSTPTYASWPNQVERWFALLTERQIRRGVHRSIKELEVAVAAFIADHNAAPRPFLWTKSANQIFSSIARFCQRTLTVHANS
jgi:hypothetical protein